MGYGTIAYGTTAPFNPPPEPTFAQASATGIKPQVQVFEPPPFQPVVNNDLVIFETPRVRDRPPYLPDSNRRQIMLMRHYENRLRGVLVWRRSDGTFCVDTPANYESAQTNPNGYISDDPIGKDLTSEEQGLVDSNVNYPWNPFPTSTFSETRGAYAFNTNWDQTTQLFVLDPYLKEWWEGGAENIVSQEEALELTRGGFGDCLKEYVP